MEMQDQGDSRVRLGESIVDFKKGTARNGGREMSLEAKELGVLRTLVDHAGELVTYEMFRERVWDGVHMEIEANVQTRVSSLRSKLAVDIKNYRTKGYILQTRVELVTVIQQEPLPAPRLATPLPVNILPPGREVGPSGPVIPTPGCQSSTLGTRLRSNSVVISVLAGLVIAVTGLASYWLAGDERLPSDFEIEGRVLKVFDQHHRFFWDYEFPDMLNPSKLLSIQWPHKFVDLDGNGHIGLIICAQSLLYYFDRHGKVVWTYKPGRETLNMQGNTVPADYYVSLVDTLSHPRPDGGRIVVGSHRGPGALFAVETLTKEGKKVDGYFHFGWFFGIKIGVLDKSSREDIFLAGVDDASGMTSNYGATLVVLDKDRVFGQAATMIGKPLAEIQGVPPAQEKAVLLIKEFVQNPEPSHYYRGQYVNFAGGFLELFVDPGSADRGAYLRFDRTLRLQNVLPAANLRNLLQSTILKTVPVDHWQEVMMKTLGDIIYVRNEFAEGK